jgi:hypothetical protein
MSNMEIPDPIAYRKFTLGPTVEDLARTYSDSINPNEPWETRSPFVKECVRRGVRAVMERLGLEAEA